VHFTVLTVKSFSLAMSKFQGKYPAEWTKEFRDKLRADCGNKCERCGHLHDPENHYCLTVHHLDNNKANCELWNLAVLCQRCHLTIQGRVNMFQGWLFEHSPWMKPHVEGMIKSWREKQKLIQEKALAGGECAAPFTNVVCGGAEDLRKHLESLS